MLKMLQNLPVCQMCWANAMEQKIRGPVLKSLSQLGLIEGSYALALWKSLAPPTPMLILKDARQCSYYSNSWKVNWHKDTVRQLCHCHVQSQASNFSSRGFSRTLLILFVLSLSSLVRANIFILIYWLNLDFKNATVDFGMENLGTSGFLNFLCNEEQSLVHYHYH